jgi:hypothetical protein
MPLLPRRNSLDFNPDSIINAGKKLKTIALANMKNPILDPDMKTLSAMDAERNLGVNIDSLGQMYLDVERDLIRVAQFAGTKIDTYQGLEGSGRRKKRSMFGGADKKPKFIIEEDEEDEDEDEPVVDMTPADINTPALPVKRRGRPKGSKNKPKPVSLFPSSAFVPPRFSSDMVSSSGNPQALPHGDPDDDDPDDDDSSYPSSASTANSRTTRSSVPNYNFPHQNNTPLYDDFDDMSDLTQQTDKPTIPKSISNLLLSIISKIQKMDFFLSSKIKPAYAKITDKQQAVLSKIMEGIFNLYKVTMNQPIAKPYLISRIRVTPTRPNIGNLEEYIIDNVDNGDDLLSYFKKALDKLILDLSVVINSARRVGATDFTKKVSYDASNPANSYALGLAGYEGGGRKVRMVGNGRNFYGDVINKSRDIPTIFSSVRDCPTKYLL